LNNVGRSYIHNGLFNVQQRGVGSFTTGYTADRWVIALSGDTVSVTVVALPDSDRTQIGDEAALTVLQDVFTGIATANSYNAILQKIENVRRISGKTVIISFWAKAISGTPRIGVNAAQNFGTGGSPSATVSTPIGATAALTTTWTRYSVSGAVPSATGKTFGTSGGDYTQVGFWFSDVSNISGNGIGQQSGTIQLWGVQLEIAQPGQTLPTPLDYGGSPQQQLAQCQRFYLTGYVDANQVPGAASIFSQMAFFPVTMRATPTIATSGFTSGNTTGSLVAYSTNVQAVKFGISSAAAGPANFQANYTASADL